jgi:hypothetical protein
MAIQTLYRGYFQKSKVFLYPLLNIKRGFSITPVQTYLHCKELDIKLHSKKLICLFHKRSDKEFVDFEKTKLIGNKLFHSFKDIEGNPPSRVYLFDYEVYSQDWNNIIKGRYSKLSPEMKRKVKDFFRSSGNNFVYVESFVHPEKYFTLYAELLGVSVDVLRSVGELCTKPDFNKELLIISNNLIQVTNEHVADNITMAGDTQLQNDSPGQ